mmetsp:Transcript_5803/g.12642  ORF Transcript_5803/g.12642 Transcript_5803/m.12642 type:complete len:506 (+) Transcript_5803:55-1572(+)
MATLKEQKEAFVTGHNGTTPTEILLVCLSAPLGIFLFNEIHRTLSFSLTARPAPRHDIVKPNKSVLVVIESLVLLLPMAICQTSLLYPYGVALLCVEAIVAICLHVYRRTIRRQQSNNATDGDIAGRSNDQKSKLAFLSSYRSTVSYLTFVAILAVDFHVFPRRFAKTETTGYGLMDLGAGSFIVSGGLVSWYARSSRAFPSEKKERNTCSNDETLPSNVYWKARLKPVLLRSIPIITMGTIRLMTNKGLEYQEHVSEYGVHWNFFFTLAVVSVASTAIRFHSSSSRIWPWLFLVLYQISLSIYGIQIYIEDGERRCVGGESMVCDFFAANREGILGCVGYLAMFLISEDIAQYCIWSADASPSTQRGSRLSVCCALLWALNWLLTSILDIQVSRRSTNATFIVWTLAHNVTILLLVWAAFYLADASTRSRISTVSPIFDAVNHHGLIVFILANLMTGLVNLSINTLAVEDTQALGIIFMYLFAVGSVALAVDWALTRRPKVKEG